jgi:hypothetical protein
VPHFVCVLRDLMAQPLFWNGQSLSFLFSVSAFLIDLPSVVNRTNKRGHAMKEEAEGGSQD